MNAALSVIGSGLIVILFAGLFCVIGRMLLCKAGIDSDNSCYTLASSYFVGMAVYLAILRTLTLVTGSYKIVFWSLLILTAVFAVITIYRRFYLWLCKNAGLLAALVGLWIAHTFHALLYRLIDVERVSLSPYVGIGTIGSLRYAGIADYFVEQNYIPVLNQSYGQSVLASFSRLLGLNNL